MAFFLGVLVTVKNENVVITYDKYINDDNKKLKSVLKLVDSKIGSGRDGLAVSVAVVKGWLEGYEREVENKIRDVNDNITQINIAFESYKNLIKHRGSESLKIVDDALTNFITDATNAMCKLTVSEAVISELDTNLKMKLSHSIDTIGQAIDSFKKSAENRDLECLTATAQEEIDKVSRELNDFVKFRVSKMWSEIYNIFNKQIREPIIGVKGNLMEVDTDLSAWIAAAAKVVDTLKRKAEEVHRRLEAHVKKITEYAKEMENGATKEVGDILASAATLLNETRKQSIELDKRREEAERHLKALQASSETALHKAEANVGNVKHLQSCKTILEQNVRSLRRACDDMNEYYLNGVRQGFEPTVASMDHHLTQLLEALGVDTKQGFEGLMVKLHNDVKGLMNLLDIARSEAEEALQKISPKPKAPKPLKSPAEFLQENLEKLLGIKPKGESIAKAINDELVTIKRRVAAMVDDFTGMFRPLDEAANSVEASFAGVKRLSEDLANDHTGIAQDVPNLRHQITAQQLRFKHVVNAIQIAGLTVKLDGLGNALGNAKQSTIQYIQDTSRRFGALTGELNSLRRKLQESKGNDIIFTLSDLLNSGINGAENTWPDQTAKGLKYIQKRLNEIIGTDNELSNDNPPTTVFGIIAAANNFYALIGKEVQNTISEIYHNVQQKVASAATNIHKKATSLYAKRKNIELDDLKTIVDTQKRALDTLIRHDRNNGLKGLLTKLNSDVENLESVKISEISETSSPETCLLNFQTLVQKFKKFVSIILFYIGDQVSTPSYCGHATNVDGIRKKFDNLLTHLHTHNSTRKYIFDNSFTKKHESLSSSLTSLSPSAFANPRHPELLDAVRQGLQGFVQEMGRVYVNKYEGGDTIKRWTHRETGDVELTVDGRNGAKIFLSILEILFHDLSKLLQGCVPRGDSHGRNIRLNDISNDGNQTKNPLGKWLHERGYTVSDDEHTQNGELDRRKNVTLARTTASVTIGFI
ncbi:hypothetical protein, conserved [Babesia bigemina]|uniref:Extracellular matrix-binding ebh n=1 Tax=Babesia bigemina TaxID=5866 RepID=A0A061BSQ1_BABBI|nr:hypothetical protein, conserved [Babesia bigemina]CDR71548.1 hypothetical protein, conserved [Babesia bigemina]|eukprot:XP_012770494.1 hypothetical protein, conserved [Babesia bigemina]